MTTLDNTTSTVPARDERGDVDAAVIAGMGLAKPRPLYANDSRFQTVVVPAGAKVEVLDLEELEQDLAPRPRRKKGTVRVQDSSSFVAYIAKHGMESTEIWADPANQGLVGVINAHSAAVGEVLDEGLAGHGDHRVVLDLIATPAWKAWVANDKKWLDQAAFAEHIEDNVLDVVEPDGATMLEIAQSFHATTGVVFKSASRLHSGEVTLNYEENTGASAGEKGDLEIPTSFFLNLQPYCGQNEAVSIQARFRYRIRGGQLSLSYALAQPDVILRGLFDEVTNRVDDAVTQPVYAGRPA